MDNDSIDEDDIDEAVRRYLENPDMIIAEMEYQFIFKVKPGIITDRNISKVQKLIRDIATDYEYPLHFIDVSYERIEARLEISVNEAPLDSVNRFLKRMGKSGIDTEIMYIGTLRME